MSKPILFLDRDGTIIVEPKPSLQVDSYDKLDFISGAISALAKIRRELGFDLVLVSNQDGLGTDSFPIDQFEGPHNLMLRILGNEGIEFREILIDSSLPDQNAPTRKPRIGLVEKYLMHPRLKDSYMIGDRQTDMQFAENLGVRGLMLDTNSKRESIWPSESAPTFSSWFEIYSYLANKDRVVCRKRVTSETTVDLILNLDGTGQYDISTGLKFLDHMLEQLAKHGNMDIKLVCKGDLEVDEHHTIEDVAITLGEAVGSALGDRRGIERYGFVLPMDEVRAEVLLDLSGRAYLIWNLNFNRECIGDVPTEMFKHFFHSFAIASRSTVHITACGENEHHLIEAVFKAFSRALRSAVQREENAAFIPSTKGMI